MNDTLNLILKRSSVRSFDPRPISDEHEQAILAAALRAPTAGNMMLYTILRLKDEKTRSTLSVTCDNQRFIAEAPLSLIFLADFTRWSELYQVSEVAKLSCGTGYSWGGPSIADFLLCCCDAMAAAQNAVIAAESLGVGTCYIGDIMEQYETHKELLKLPEHAFPIAMLCLGYPKSGAAPKPRPRFNARYIVHDEEYQAFTGDELLSMIGESRPGDKPSEFVRKFFLRKQGAEFSREMARSVQSGLNAFLQKNGGDSLV